jgi:hypothetical protein
VNFEEDWYPEDEECVRCGGLDTTYRDMLGYQWHRECLEARDNEASAMSKMWRKIRNYVDRT